YPDLVLHIAPVALENFKSAQAEVLEGDRDQGGFPSVALQQFCGHSTEEQTTETQALDTKPSSPTKTNIEAQPKTTPDQTEGWLKRRWKRLTQSADAPETLEEETLEQEIPKEKTLEEEILEKETLEKETSEKETLETSSVTLEISSVTLEKTSEASKPAAESSGEPKPVDTVNLASFELAELTPTELNALNILPQHPVQESARPLESPSDASPPQNTQPQNTPPQNTQSQNNSATIRMSTEYINSLSQAMGELLTQQNRQTLYNEQLTALVKNLLNRISQQQQLLNQQHTEQLIRPPHALRIHPTGAVATDQHYAPKSDTAYSHFDSLELEQYNEVQLLLQTCLEENVQQSENAEAIELFVKRSEQTLEKQKRLLANTRETLLAARMVPLETVFQQFPSTVERLKTQHQKPVEVDLEGGDILVDRTIADSLYEPLVHLVRNAFDHGIETPDERLAQNKPFTGTITVKGQQQGRHLLISVADDGQGLDLERIREAAIALQLVTPAAAQSLTPQQTIDLLFEPGFSTASTTNELSGRGIGLDAVQARVRSLKGWVTISHNPGKGTCFTLQIPTGVSIANLLLCQTQSRVYALIADTVKHILIPTPQQIRTWKGGSSRYELGKV
ncbi:MAG: ATP-binding protein, partial [Cyanobacteria bacterium J06576_12]